MTLGDTIPAFAKDVPAQDWRMIYENRDIPREFKGVPRPFIKASKIFTVIVKDKSIVGFTKHVDSPNLFHRVLLPAPY